MTEQLLQNETIKEISNHLQQKLRDNISHLQKICYISSEECSSLKEQILAMKFYIDQRCQEYSQLIMDVNAKGESRELLKKLADLMTISDLLNEGMLLYYSDISFYKDKIKQQEQEIDNLNEQVRTERLKVEMLTKAKEDLAVILQQEAKQARKDLETELDQTKKKLILVESDFLQQVFNLETTNKQQTQKIVDLETGRASLIKTIQLKEELYKKQQSHYEQKLSDTKLYWQNKLSEKSQELQNELKESASQWEIKNKCIANDFEIHRRYTQEQIDLLNLQMAAKDKDYDKLKEQYEKHLQDLKIKENYFSTHKEEHDKVVDNLQSQVSQLKELQINLEQRVNIQNYEINKQVVQYKDVDSKIKKEQQKCIELQQNLLELQQNFNEQQFVLQNQNEQIIKLYKSAASFLKLEILSHTPQQMLLFTQEYLQTLFKQNQDLLLEKTELDNQIQSQGLEWKQKCNKLSQMNASQEKRLQELDRKLNDLQILQLRNSLQKSMEIQPKKDEPQPIKEEAQPKREEIKVHHYGMHKLEDLQIFLSNLEKSEVVKKQESPHNSQDLIEQSISEHQTLQNSIKQSENKPESIGIDRVESFESQKDLPENEDLEESKDKIVESEADSLEPPQIQEQKTILLMGSAENDQDYKDLEKSQIKVEDPLMKQTELEKSKESKVEGPIMIQTELEKSKESKVEDPVMKQTELEKSKESIKVETQKESLNLVTTESITLKDYFDQEVEEKQNILLQKNEADFHFQKTINKLRIIKKNPKKQNLKLVTDNINRTPETGYETTKVSRSTQIQTDWRLMDSPGEVIIMHDEQTKLDFENLQKEFGKLSIQLTECEQDKLRMSLIIEYLQKMLPIPKITQEISTQINNDDQLYRLIQQLKDENESIKSSAAALSQEQQKNISEKESQIDELKDLIVNMSDQIYSYRFEIKEKKDLIKELNDKIEFMVQQNQQPIQVVVTEKETIDNKPLKSNTLNVKREIKDRPSTPNKVESNEDLRLKIFQLEKLIRNLNNKIAKKDLQLNQRQNQGEVISQLQQMQNMNVEVQDLRKQLESKSEQLGKCTTIIKYLEIELENYKSNFNIFNKPKLNTERTARHVQQALPYQVSMSVQQKLPTLQEDMNTTISRSSYKKRYLMLKLEITLSTRILLRIMIQLEMQLSLQNQFVYNYKMIDKFLDQAYKGELLNENAIKIICLTLKEIFSKEPNVKRIPTPVTIVGDVHGQLYDVQELLQVGGKPPFTNYLFLGDYVDRGAHSVEVITLLSLLKVKFPNRVTLIRGNHETRGITQNYGFYMECQQKYGNTQAWEYFTDMFDYIPIACIVGTNLLCVHGGLSPCIESVDEIEHLNRFQEIPHEGAFTDIMWSDPDDEDTPGFKISPRGAGFVFGGQVLKEFLHFNDMTHLIRAHQLCNEGFNLKFDDKCITVWSAPNYLYRNGNLASILEIDELGNRYFNIFSESPENMKKDLGTKSMMMGPDNYFT